MLKKIGDIMHLSHDRRFVIKLSFTPPLGITIYDYAMKRLGVLYDIIGPVNSPYGLAKPDPQLSKPEDFVGKSAYIRDVDLRKKRGGGHGHGK
ncbi:H/ACA ribonucleoprotein complex subunit GAR1 [Vulcanisaeta distributa]|uniref:H/ACA RNA-protein complex component Gar1 n=1 Tax=Vulcanisaeta distributa (strain DSM 14429 / JCM 11212 / NBRC 100878 / IC-017) TaxID=572478 RepID=E1QNQ1_VULDI|nr:Gar1/Naf1 family protein [Vulcanisaeta distributa]ADN50147.1 H/ACA RNA-protein complex component Gar1 [Vulcanisaeta distributa DSM 14429]